MSGVALRGIHKRFGATDVLRDVTLEAKQGEFLAILGASGCGKSTLLRILAGLETADEGEVWVDGKRMDALPPKRRNLAMVFQSYALYPYMTVAQNIALPLEMRRLSAWQRIPLLGRLMPGTSAARRAIAGEVEGVAKPLGLLPLLARKPAQLSGGLRQRVALGRAMARRPAAFLMDEPLSNLDARMRGEARSEIVALTQRLGVTTLYVTHDQNEAMAMADRVAVMQAGQVLQFAPPQELYDEPVSLDVARFVGSPPMNALPAQMRADGAIEVAGTVLSWRGQGAPGAVTFGVRPESWHPAGHGIPADVARLEHLGAETLIHVVVAGHPAIVRVAPEAARGLNTGETLHLAASRALLFGPGGLRLPMHATIREVALG
jgi:multiple sugar transport system ATP-binding protein